MYKNIITIDKEQIETLGITAQEKYYWVDTTLRNKSEYVLPTKTRSLSRSLTTSMSCPVPPLLRMSLV